jgi:hypothetical protein
MKMKPADVFGVCYKCGSTDIQHEDNGRPGGKSWRSSITCGGCGRRVIIHSPASFNAQERFQNERQAWMNKE